MVLILVTVNSFQFKSRLRTFKGMLLSERSQSASNHVTVYKRRDYGDSEGVSGCRGRERGRAGQNTDAARGRETTVDDAVMTAACHRAFVQTHGTCIASSEPGCKPRLWVTVAGKVGALTTAKAHSGGGGRPGGRLCVGRAREHVRSLPTLLSILL